MVPTTHVLDANRYSAVVDESECMVFVSAFVIVAGAVVEYSSIDGEVVEVQVKESSTVMVAAVPVKESSTVMVAASERVLVVESIEFVFRCVSDDWVDGVEVERVVHSVVTASLLAEIVSVEGVVVVESSIVKKLCAVIFGGSGEVVSPLVLSVAELSAVVVTENSIGVSVV